VGWGIGDPRSHSVTVRPRAPLPCGRERAPQRQGQGLPRPAPAGQARGRSAKPAWATNWARARCVFWLPSLVNSFGRAIARQHGQRDRGMGRGDRLAQPLITPVADSRAGARAGPARAPSAWRRQPPHRGGGPKGTNGALASRQLLAWRQPSRRALATRLPAVAGPLAPPLWTDPSPVSC